MKDSAGDCLVDTTVLLGHSILVLEDESLIALEITEALRRGRIGVQRPFRPDASACQPSRSLGGCCGFSVERHRPRLRASQRACYPIRALYQLSGSLKELCRNGKLIAAFVRLLH